MEKEKNRSSRASWEKENLPPPYWMMEEKEPRARNHLGEAGKKPGS